MSNVYTDNKYYIWSILCMVYHIALFFGFIADLLLSVLYIVVPSEVGDVVASAVEVTSLHESNQ